MQVRCLAWAAVAGVTATIAMSLPASAQRGPMHVELMQPRHANIVADARGRSIDEALSRQNYHGPTPTAVVSQSGNVSTQQMGALGFRKIKPNAAGFLVQVDVHDATGYYQDLYVYNPRTHFVTSQIEKVVLPKAATQSRVRKI